MDCSDKTGKKKSIPLLRFVSESSQNYESFKTLEPKVKKLVWEYIVVSADEPDSIRLGIMKRIMLEEPEEYRKLENDLSGAKRESDAGSILCRSETCEGF